MNPVDVFIHIHSSTVSSLVSMTACILTWPMRFRRSVKIFVGGSMDEPPVPCYHVNCLVFGDPSTFHLRSHLGCHHEIMRAVINSRKFLPAMQDIASHVKVTPESSLYCQCSKGRHRSVAMATVIRHVVQQIWQANAVVKIEYLSKHGWSNKQHDCIHGNCWPCSYLPDNIDAAVQAWAWIKSSCCFDFFCIFLLQLIAKGIQK